LIEENVTVLSAFVNINPFIKNELKKAAYWMRRELQQEAFQVI